MDFTKKIKSLVNLRQGSRSVDISDAESPEDKEVVIQCEKEPVNEILTNPEIESEILNSIEDVFYSNEQFDASEYILTLIPEAPDINEIHSEREKMVSQLQVVSKKLSDLILQNQSALAEELQRVTEMQRNLEEAWTTCVQSRSFLSQTKKFFTTASLGIVASYRKREQLKCLLRSLYMIKTLQETDVRLRELLEEEDYPGAIQLLLECQKAASTFKHFSCISELSTKLQDTLVMTEEQLDVALSKVCSNFDKVHYEKLQEAYSLLGKTQTAVDQLLMHFASAIHNTAFRILVSYAEKNTSVKDQSFQKRQYSDLCKLIDCEHFTACLEDLCKALWKIMCSYWCILEWHGINEGNSQTSEDPPGTDSFHQDYIKQKLDHGLLRVWQDVQQKVKSYLLASDLSPFKFDEFIHILALIQRLIDIGEDFCGSRSEDLQESVRKQSVNYFRNYHRGFMEELRTFLENEIWGICPVHCSFSTIHLQEFRFLTRLSFKTSNASPERSSGLPRRANFFKRHSDKFNPFEEKVEDDEKEDILSLKENDDLDKTTYDSDSDDEIPDELKKDYIDENTEEYPHKVQSKLSKKVPSSVRKKQIPILTNTALNVLRSFGKYMQMMSVLKPIAFDVLICMTQLFDYYMYSVYIFFAKEMSDLSENSLSNKLKTTLKRIRENLMCETDSMESLDTRNKDKIPPPTLSTAVNLRKIEDLYGLAERVAAAESLVFLAGQFELLHPHLEQLIPPTKIAFLQQFCSQTVSQASELRRPTYMGVCARAVDYDQVVALMGAVRWDGEEIGSQHSTYVDILLRELQVFSMRLSEVSKKVPIPKEAYDLLWEHCIKFSNNSFIEGFSSAKKCTNGGRALMQLDYQQFLSKVERLTDLQPVPGKERVESYVKAYYMLEQNLEHWIRCHKDYSNKQLLGLVSCITQLNKKGRQRLITLIEEGEKLKR